MKRSWLIVIVSLTVIAVSSPTVLADNCCGEKTPPKEKGTSGEVSPVSGKAASPHGGALTKEASFVFETSILAEQVRVYVFDAKGAPVSVSKLKGRATYAPAKGKKTVVTLKPVNPKKGRSQGYLQGRHRFPLTASKGAEIDVEVSGLGDDRKGTATWKAPLVQAPTVSYVCPMHPDQTSEDPGKCQKCGGMELQRKVTNVPKATADAKAAYVCPMHPKATSDKPGKCPDCGMALKKSNGTQKAAYGCPMHPKVTSDKPGRCPDCGMNLIQRKS